MNDIKKIIAVTGTRADYGIYTSIFEAIQESGTFELSLLVTGMHLSPDYGDTLRHIKEDGYKVEDTVDILLHGSTQGNMARAIGLGVLGMTQVFEKSKPDLVMVLGDRGEMLSASIAASHLNIPIAHLHGGEVSGSIDESVRHAISKFAHIHFTSTKENKERLVKMGEDPWRVHSIGAPRLESLTKKTLPELNHVKAKYNLAHLKEYYLLVYHPVTTSMSVGAMSIRNIIEALLSKKKEIVVIMPNSDAGSDTIRKVYQEYENNNYINLVTNFEHLDYLTMLKYSSALLGNSSSGIIEAATFKVPVINIGDRQRNRERSLNVIDSKDEFEDILKSIDIIGSFEYREMLTDLKNVYGDGNVSSKLINVLKSTKIETKLINKVIAY